MCGSTMRFQKTLSLLAVCILFMANARSIENLPDTFYNRPGLKKMLHLDWTKMPVVNVKDFGAKGDGIQDATPFFTQALDKLIEQGGGVFYIPNGEYILTHDPDNDFSKMKVWGKTVLTDVWPGKKYQGLKNIHFVGDGIGSVLHFRFSGLASSFYIHSGAFMFKSAQNISVRNLSLTQSPFNRQRRGGDVKIGNALIARDCSDFQVINVNIDQGELGMGFLRSSNIWVVDCDIRNTVADNIKVDDCDNVTLAYNWLEEPMDDNTSMIYYTQHRPTPSKGLRYINNTILGPAFGRGYIMCGEDILVHGNWIERCYGNGITIYGRCSNTTIEKNTLIRCGLSARADNPWPSDSGYSSALRIGGKGFKLLGNQIFGSADIAILCHSMNDATITDNRIEDSAGQGMLFGDHKGERTADIRCRNTDISNNTFVANKAPILLSASFENVTGKNNRVTQAPKISIPATHPPVADDADSTQEATPMSENELLKMFAEETIVPEYHDYYAFARKLTAPSLATQIPESQITEKAETRSVSVKSFGAVGDGKTNDLPAFQKAIDAVAKTGGTIVVPKGKYLIQPLKEYESSPFTAIKQHVRINGLKNIQIRGEGIESVLEFSSVDHQGIRFLGCHNVSVRDLRLHANSDIPLRRNRALLDFSGCEGALAYNLYAGGGNGPAIQFDTTNHGIVRNCTVSNAGQYGIRVEASCGVDVLDNRITSTRDNAIHIGYSGSILRDSDYVKVKGNTIDGTKEGAGITVISGKVELDGNTIANTYLSGIYVYQPAMGWAMNKLTIRNNTIRKCAEQEAHAGILFSTPVRRGNRGNVLIEQNSMVDLPRAAIKVTFGRLMVWGTQGLKSFVVKNNTYENIKGEKVVIDKQFNKGVKDNKVKIDTLTIEDK